MLGIEPTILSNDDGLEPAVAKKQKHSTYESVSLPEGNLLF